MSNVTDTLIKAGLLNEVQVQVALHDQTLNPEMRLGEILSLRGWIAEETVDFFDLVWEMRVKQADRQSIGSYFVEARLMTDAQVEDVLVEQKVSNMRFGEVAVLKGYLKQETVRFFVEHLFPEQLRVKEVSPFSRITQSTESQAQRRTMTNDSTVQQTEETVDETNRQYQKGQARPKPFPPKPAAQRKNLLDRLKKQVQNKITEVNRAANSPDSPAAKRKKNQPSPPPRKRNVLPKESISTSPDLSTLEDEDFDFLNDL
ncbi:hypothetical protein Lepto7376_1419 [[Leptolyngbya] sp. PCC 7376]|uniref:hypothetical protein n=1 Tax=[Leptolyngbya] sp. PCC 7376 TaxID=111781 RepID=UPI00029F3F57|nr:hypothetical protein [[Leptolyngbya] sp. PCC 7376]AFY37763.1 hypothetical protein Lepto7376_1419 [[Leptolyngbya] sp. PCC 7376]